MPPSGSIVDLGIRKIIHLYVYRFDKATKCSSASEDDFKSILYTKKQIDFPSVGLSRNVAWSFFLLRITVISYDLTQEFASPNIGLLHLYYVYRRPDTEIDHVECLYSTIYNHYQLNTDEIKATKIVGTAGNKDHFCQFSGGGDIASYILKN